jgi:ABC-2 type transport system ATP-binding protein
MPRTTSASEAPPLLPDPTNDAVAPQCGPLGGGSPNSLTPPAPCPDASLDPVAIPAAPRVAGEGPALRFVDVVRRYGEHVALDHLNLEVARGETLALLGPNGAGKSTTIALFLGLLRADEGQVEVLGTSPRQAVARGQVGAMLQQGSGNGLPPGVRVGKALRMVSRLYPRPMDLTTLVERTGIAGLDRRTDRLSGGEAQRVRFAMALVGMPDLLFLDEPTAAMDVEARQTFWQIIRRLGQGGQTVVFATHHLDEADYADRVVVINRGRVVADGPGATLKAAVATRQLRFVVDEPDRELLDRLQGVTDVEVRGTGVVLNSLDADATVRDLVDKEVAFSNLEVAGACLEDAFLALTRGDHLAALPTRKGPDLAGKHA